MEFFVKPKKAFVVTKLDDVAGCLKYQGKPKFDKYILDGDRQDFLGILKKYSQFIEIKSQINTCRDADDNKFLALTERCKCRIFNHRSPKPFITQDSSRISKLDYYSQRLY
jgi:putative PIN family toxin of toxin-antitoxin system